MKKKFIMITVIAACLALCAAVWPQSESVEEVPATLPFPIVPAAQPEIPELPRFQEQITPEEEKDEIPRAEPLHEIVSEPEPTPAIPEAQAITDPAPAPKDAPTTPKVLPTPEPEPTPTSAPSQTVTDPQPGDMVYVPGFGWLVSQGPGEVIYAEDMYENGNKIGSMG